MSTVCKAQAGRKPERETSQKTCHWQICLTFKGKANVESVNDLYLYDYSITFFLWQIQIAMSLKKNFRFLSAILFGVLFAACDKPGLYPGGALKDAPIECLVLNEGLLNTNAGALSVVYQDSSVVVDAFQDVNHRPMGDVAQSVTLINGKYFVAMNNSKKVEILDPVTFRSLGTILYKQAGYPRQIVPVSPTEAIVSDLRNQLVRIRTVEPYGEPLEYISIPTWIEYLIGAENKIFGMTEKGVLIFDANRIVKEEARLLREVHNEEYTKTCRMLKDKHGMIWALMNLKQGNKVTGIVLVCIDPLRERVAKRCVLPLGEELSEGTVGALGYVNYNRTDIDPTGTWIYFNAETRSEKSDSRGEYRQQSVFRLNVDSGKFEHYRDLPGIGMMYGFAVSPAGDVYLCDCLDYTAQRGYVRCYRADGHVDSYRVGVYPSQVYFPGYEY